MAFRDFIKKHHPLPEIVYKRRRLRKIKLDGKTFRRGQRVTHVDTPEDIGIVWRELPNGTVQVHWTTECGEPYACGRILDTHDLRNIRAV